MVLMVAIRDHDGGCTDNHDSCNENDYNGGGHIDNKFVIF